MTAHAGWVHCPRCAAALESGPVGSGETRLHCPACGLVIYDNPAPTATAIVTRDDGAILFTRRAIEPAFGMLDLPGGFIELEESPEQAVKRELMEETGLEIELTGYLGTFPDRYGEGAHTLNMLLHGGRERRPTARGRRRQRAGLARSRCGAGALPDCVCQQRRGARARSGTGTSRRPVIKG